MAIIIPPKRGEFFTKLGIPTNRFITWIESLTTQSNEITGEVSETSELISGVAVQEVEVIATSTDFTTTGTQVIICTNTADIDITLNPTPDDGEQLHIKMQNTGKVNIIGAIDGQTILTVRNRYDAPHLIFTVDAGEFSII